MTTSVKQAWQPAGVGYLPVAIVGVLQLDNYNANNVVMLKRDIRERVARCGERDDELALMPLEIGSDPISSFQRRRVG